MTYATVDEIKEEFKNINFTTGVLTLSQIERFLQETDALINSFVGSRYQTPITGTQPVAQVTEVTVNTVLDSTQYTCTIDDVEFSFTSGVGATDLQIRDGLLALIQASTSIDVSAASGSTDAKYVLTSNTPGNPFVVSVDGNQSTSETTANVLGSDGLKVIRKIEIDIVACRVAKILRVKTAAVLDNAGVKQEILDSSCHKMAVEMLKGIQKGKYVLDGADLVASGGGLESFTQSNLVDPSFKRFTDQW